MLWPLPLLAIFEWRLLANAYSPPVEVENAETYQAFARRSTVRDKKNAYMDCGDAHLCGVLTLETGLGSGVYKHANPSVHGLWPETGDYGTSSCIAPKKSQQDPAKVFACYDEPETGTAAELAFEVHEWEKHGECAGVADAVDYFGQICKLAAPPIDVLKKARAGGAIAMTEYATALKNSGFSVFDTDSYHGQVLLSACATPAGVWKLADVKAFSTMCGDGWPPLPPTPPPPPPATKCVPYQKGPPCKLNSDCGFPGCIRCAKSGFCTDVPLPP
eukprot:6196300-Pleurochrysis_carterae.AAC.3